MPKKKETERADKRLPLYVDVESFEPPRYLEEDNTNGWELVSRNDWTFEILRYNKTGMVLYPFFVKSKRSKVSDDNLAGAMCFTSEGERVTPVPKHIRAVCEKYRQMFLKKWNGRRYDPKDVSNFEDISRPKRGTEQRKEEEHDEDDNDPEPRKRTPKKGKRKQRKSGESSYKYPMTLRLLKGNNNHLLLIHSQYSAEVERVTKIITHRMGIEEESKKGIAFIDKDSDLQRLYKTEKETGRKTREYLKVRATGVKLVEGKSPRIAPILKIGNKHIEYKAAGALKYVYSIALGIPIGEVKEKAGLGQLKGYTKLVELADRDKPLNDLYQVQYRYPKAKFLRILSLMFLDCFRSRIFRHLWNT